MSLARWRYIVPLRVRSLLRREPVEQELDEELRFHLDQRIAANVASGMAPDEAARASRVALGNQPLIRERTRDAWGWRWLDEARYDVRHALRGLRKSPAFATTAVVTLALSAGSATAIFSVVDAVVLRALPFDQPDRLVALGNRSVARPAPRLNRIAPQDFLDWQQRQQVLDGLAAFVPASPTLLEPGVAPEELHAVRVSASFFDVLRVPALMGRTFTPEEDVDGRHRVAVLSYGWWQRRFGRDPNIVGTTIHLDSGDVEIVGIAPPAVSQALDAETPTDLWMPLVIPDAERMRSPNRYNFYLQALGRLRDGLSRAQASVGLNQMAQVLEAEYPDWNKDRRIGVRPLDEHVVPAGIRSWLLLLLGAVGVVLVIAYANIAALMVARASERQREIGIRAALGASRLRIVRQLVVESLVVSLIGAGVGLVLAWWAVEGLRAAMPDGVPRVVTVALDLRVFAAAVGGAVVSGVVFGLVPAGGCSRPVLTQVLQDGARGATAGRARQRLRSTLVVSEIALAVVLLIGAGLFLVSFVNLMRVDVGFDPAGVLTAWVAPQPDGEMTDRASVALTDTVDRVRQIRDVEAVTAVSGTSPAGTGVAAIKIAIPGRTRDGGEQVLAAIVTPDYHRVLRIPLHAGRYFDEGDRRGSEPVVLLGAATARQYFPGADPVGDVIDVNGTRRQIVGVVGDIRPYRDWQLVSALVYLPVTQHPIGGSHLLIRTTGDPLAPLPLVRAAVAGVLPDVVGSRNPNLPSASSFGVR